MPGLHVPLQRFSREDPLYRQDAAESIARSFIGGDIDSDLLSPSMDQLGDVGASQIMTRGANTLGRGLTRGITGLGSLAAGPLSVALGRLYSPSVSSGTITPGGPQGQRFADVASYEALEGAIAEGERQRRLELIAAGQRLRALEMERNR